MYDAGRCFQEVDEHIYSLMYIKASVLVPEWRPAQHKAIHAFLHYEYKHKGHLLACLCHCYRDTSDLMS